MDEEIEMEQGKSEDGEAQPEEDGSDKDAQPEEEGEEEGSEKEA
jgi:hypothetical protein